MPLEAIKYRLGLDVGTNSLGWSVLGLDSKNQPCRIEAAGVRIFSEGREPKSKATLAATRRAARSARRRRDRFKQRQQFLLSELTKMGLFPEGGSEREALQNLNPLELRAKALTAKLKPYEIGRALFHLNQRRGFKSNRKDRSEDTVSGKVADSYRALLQEMGLIKGQKPTETEGYKKLSKEEKRAARKQETENRRRALEDLRSQKGLTYGAFLWRRQQEGKPVRARSGAGSDGKLYDVYPIRELYEDEFAKIWDAQAQHHRGLMTEDARKRIHSVIFTQRPLKPQKRGFCTYTYMSKEQRAFRAMPSFQRYRIYQEVNNLEWRDEDGHRQQLANPEAKSARDLIVGLLMQPSVKSNPTDRNASVSFHKMRTELKKRDLVEGDVFFNFETAKRKGFDGDQTANVMQHEDYVGSDWHTWSLDKQDAFISTILDSERADDESVRTDDEVRDILMGEYGLDYAAAEKCLSAPLVDGTANVSVKAAKMMMEVMRDGIEHDGVKMLPIQSDAAAYLSERNKAFKDPMRRTKTAEAMEKLPYYGDAFQNGRHIIPGDRDPKDKWDERKYYGGVTNPTVHIALNQIRQVVNELIGCYGHPESIAIELGRNLPVGADGRKEIEQEQKKNQENNERIDKILREHGVEPNRDSRIRLRLWEELDEEDPNGRLCPFTGTKIGIADLFSDRMEVEHLIPFSQSLDDSYANKVVCTRQANRDKGQRTPHEAFHDSPEGYDWGQILRRVNDLSKSKQWRFQENAREIWQRDHSGFTERHLNDTRYIGRLAREYLECICHIDKISVLTGRLTALLRGRWGLNRILSADGRKTRDDHRHHAVDAIVIGMTSRAMLQKVSTAANRAEERELKQLFVDGREIDPWKNFRQDVRSAVEGIVVSHKPSRKKLRPGATDGQLHNETAYGLVSGPDDKGVYGVVTRKPMDWFGSIERIDGTTTKIRDARLRSKFKSAFESAEKSGKKGLEGVAKLARKLGIRHLRVRDKLSAIPIRDKHDDPYKLYKGDSNWGVEIYAYPQGHKKAGKWEGQVISRFDANQHDFKPGESRRPHPAANLVMRLQADDFIELERGSNAGVYRLQKINRDGRMYFISPNEANVDARVRDKEIGYLSQTANQLQASNARRVHLSPAGRVSRESQPKQEE